MGDKGRRVGVLITLCARVALFLGLAMIEAATLISPRPRSLANLLLFQFVTLARSQAHKLARPLVYPPNVRRDSR
jgi:hypothetical protein